MSTGAHPGTVAVMVAIVVIALHRVHGAGAAPPPDQLPEAAGRQPDVRGRRPRSCRSSSTLSGVIPADLRILAAAAAGHGFASFSADQHRKRPSWVHDDHCRRLLGHGQARSIMFLFCGLLIVVLRILLHGDRVQSAGDGGQPQEAWRLHSRAFRPGRADGRADRLCAHTDHG